MGIKAGILLIPELMDSCHKEVPVVLLEPLQNCSHDVFIIPESVQSFNALLIMLNTGKSQDDSSGPYGGCSSTFQHMECSISWTVQAIQACALSYIITPLVSMPRHLDGF
jgi:hypothetical protein